MRELLELIFQHLSPDCLDIVKQVSKTAHSVSKPLIADFVHKRRIQKVRRMFFDIYDKFRLESRKTIGLIEFESAGHVWMKYDQLKGKLVMGLVDSSFVVRITELRPDYTYEQYEHMEIFHDRIVGRDAVITPLPDDLLLDVGRFRAA